MPGFTKERIKSPEVAEPPEGTWSNCIKVGDHVFIAGMLADTGGGKNPDVASQTRDIFRKIKCLMEAAGGSMADVVQLVIYAADMDERPAILAVRREFFEGDFPVSTLVEVSRLIGEDLRLEINAHGIVGAGA